MKSLYIKRVNDIRKNLALLQKSLGVGLKLKGGVIDLTGKEENIYFAENVLAAMDVGFDVDVALLLADQEYSMDVINLRDVTRRKNLSEVRARIIGTKGKTKQLLETLSDSVIKLRGNTVYVIGTADYIDKTRTAIEKLIRGSKQGKVYAFVERSKKKSRRDKFFSLGGGFGKGGKNLEESDLEDNKRGNKRVKMGKIKRKKAPDKFSKNKLVRGIKYLENPEDEGLEYED